MSTSIWGQANIGNLIQDILDQVVNTKVSAHHFGHPFITAYQLAILFNERHPNIVALLPFHSAIGGKGLNLKNSLAQYLAKELSSRIKSGEITTIDGAYLDTTGLDVSFLNTEPSSNQTSIFRSLN